MTLPHTEPAPVPSLPEPAPGRGAGFVPRSRAGSSRAEPAVLVPAALGLAAAVALRLLSPTKNVYAETRLWIAAAVTGLLVTTVVVLVARTRAREAAATAAGRQAAAADAAAEHRRFLLRLDHELKNPVTAIQAGLANLSPLLAPPDSPPDPPAGASVTALHSVSAQARRLADLVADLRKLAELETRPLERAPVDVAEMLAEAHDASLELPGAGERTITLTVPQAPWPLGTVPGDRDLLFLAVHNLLVNAVKFSQPGDRIELRARDEGDHLLVEVADTGIGIPADEVDHIWDDLARGSAAAGTPGSGLGLALARVVVGRHGGTVAVRSRVGDGTVMALRLPAS
jgi:two-component system, OmpR family, sensor kinase